MNYQTLLINLMKHIGFSVDRGGICYGFTQMATLAYLLGPEAWQLFESRLQFLSAHHNDGRWKTKFRNYVQGTNSLAPNIDSIQEWLQRSDLYSSPTIHDKSEQKQREIAQFIDILSFSNGIQVHQSPEDNPEFRQGTQQSLKSYALITPLMLKDRIVHTATFSGCYTTQNLQDLLDLIKRLSANTSVAIQLDNGTHIIGVMGASTAASANWRLLDANQLISQHEITNLGPVLYDALMFTDHSQLAPLRVTLFSLDHEWFNELQTSTTFQEMHQITRERAMAQHPKNNIDWLTLATKAGQIDLVRSLLNQYPQPSSTIINLITQSIGSGQIQLIDFFLSQVTRDQLSTNDIQSLHIAAQEGHVPAIKRLLDFGINPNAVNQQGYTPLYCATYYGQHNAIEFLLMREGLRANINAENGDQRITALHLAVEKGYADVVEILLRHGAAVNPQNANGSTPLHIAIKKKDPLIVRMLLEAHADPFLYDQNNVNPLSLAITKDYTPFLDALAESCVSMDPNNENFIRTWQNALQHHDKTTVPVICSCLKLGIDWKPLKDLFLSRLMTEPPILPDFQKRLLHTYAPNKDEPTSSLLIRLLNDWAQKHLVPQMQRFFKTNKGLKLIIVRHALAELKANEKPTKEIIRQLLTELETNHVQFDHNSELFLILLAISGKIEIPIEITRERRGDANSYLYQLKLVSPAPTPTLSQTP